MLNNMKSDFLDIIRELGFLSVYEAPLKISPSLGQQQGLNPRPSALKV